jgi:chorismate synthase
MRVVEDLQKEVWTLHDRDITPLTQLVAAKHAGGQLIGARDGGALVGFVYGFVGLEGGRTIHHSHMLAVKPAYRHLNVGYKLKVAQRERVLAQGITRMTWTFDPLQSLNAYFNFCKLGVVSYEYKVNFYGPETSSVLHRIGTDRLLVTWNLDTDRRERAPHDGAQTFIEIPSDINSIQQQSAEEAMRWREDTRRAFTQAFAAGFYVADFFRRESAGVYVLNQERR